MKGAEVRAGSGIEHAEFQVPVRVFQDAVRHGVDGSVPAAGDDGVISGGLRRQRPGLFDLIQDHCMMRGQQGGVFPPLQPGASAVRRGIDQDQQFHR
ncbi:hypothetical protein SDC9_178676 [bioreactor metagenome]|uniref:Uncharacterized protein n=1 Tax=bioreactor metagenome TaxID=1076179 RepID=A0A645GYS0_9ZZZZ